jgi:hypothetical protein
LKIFFSVSSRKVIRLKGRMLPLAHPIVPLFKEINVPSDCSFGQLRHLIGMAFELPTDLEVVIFYKGEERLEAGEIHRLGRLSELAIQFDIQKFD